MAKSYDDLLENIRQLTEENEQLKKAYDKLGEMYDDLSLSYEDALMMYDQAKENDMEIVGRVHELSEHYGVSMSQIALAWHFSKGVTAPIVGGSKIAHLEEAIGAVDIELKPEDVAYLEEPYRPHAVVGALPE